MSCGKTDAMALNIRPPTEALAIPTVCEAARASSAALRAGIASGTAMVTARAAGARERLLVLNGRIVPLAGGSATPVQSVPRRLALDDGHSLSSHRCGRVRRRENSCSGPGPCPEPGRRVPPTPPHARVRTLRYDRTGCSAFRSTCGVQAASTHSSAEGARPRGQSDSACCTYALWQKHNSEKRRAGSQDQRARARSGTHRIGAAGECKPGTAGAPSRRPEG